MKFNSITAALATVAVLAFTATTVALPSPDTESLGHPVTLERRDFMDFFRSPDTQIKSREAKKAEFLKKAGQLDLEIEGIKKKYNMGVAQENLASSE
ncbi:hypothetical protein H4R33_003506 [Dimargaris cristalligena]|nr:hypothetical protein H4R33_003506 [Dimargaris cristalligena]